jgi:hypothetical protein
MVGRGACHREPLLLGYRFHLAARVWGLGLAAWRRWIAFILQGSLDMEGNAARFMFIERKWKEFKVQTQFLVNNIFYY